MMIRLFRLFAWACVAVIAALSLVAPSLRPVTFLPHDLEHAAIFAIAGALAGLGYPDRTVHSVAGLTVFAGVIELAQLFAPGRHARLSDFMIDTLAACAGIGVALVAANLWMVRRRPA